MKLPRSINKLEDSLDYQLMLLEYYLRDNPMSEQSLKEFKQNNAKIKELIEHSAMDRKISHARFLNKLRGLGFIVETEFTFMQRLKIALLFLFKRLDPDQAAPGTLIENPKDSNEVE